MANHVSASSDFTETLAIHSALKSAVRSKVFDTNPEVKKAAQKLCKDLDSERSIYGRQLKMLGLMQKGASVAELGKKLGASRRTLFRYLNYLEQAGIEIKLENNKYYVGKHVLKLVKV
ncbi:MAG: HTH domain-containing protein [Planctomycetota bacterium]|jgi:biotin operon repressor